MKTIPYFLIFLATLCLPHQLQAQYDLRPGYIITNDLDSIRGFIKYSESNSRYYQVKFSKNWKGAFETKALSELHGYGSDDGYIFKKVKQTSPNPELYPDSSFFLILSEGKLDVLQSEGPRFWFRDSLDRLYPLADSDLDKSGVIDPEGDDYRGDRFSAVGTLVKLTSDCPDVARGISSGEYYLELKSHRLSKIVSIYNDCVGTSITHVNKKPRVRLIPYVSGGFGVNSPWYSEATEGSYSSQDRIDQFLRYDYRQMPYYEFGVRFFLPRFNENIGLIISGALTNYYYEGAFNGTQSAISTDTLNAFASHTFSSAIYNFGFQVRPFWGGYLQPLLDFGITTRGNSREDSEYTIEWNYGLGRDNTTETGPLFSLRPRTYGLFWAVGFSIPVNPSWIIRPEIKYQGFYSRMPHTGPDLLASGGFLEHMLLISFPLVNDWDIALY